MVAVRSHCARGMALGTLRWARATAPVRVDASTVPAQILGRGGAQERLERGVVGTSPNGNQIPRYGNRDRPTCDELFCGQLTWAETAASTRKARNFIAKNQKTRLQVATLPDRRACQ